MYRDKSVSVVVPAFNEEQGIRKVLESIPDFVDRVIVVDDSSTDGTAAAVSSVTQDRVELIRRDKNGGVGAAMKSGYKRAIEAGAGLVVKLDGDGQMNPLDIPALCDPIINGSCDYAKGNRFLGKGHARTMPFTRVVGNIGMTFLTKLASGYWNIFDPQNGFTAISGEMLERIELERIAGGYFFENSMLLALNLQEARVKDVPIASFYGDEKSGVSIPRVLVTFPIHLLRTFATRIWQRYVVRDFSPVALFLFFGALLFVWGLGFGAFIWTRSIQTGVPATTGTVMLSVLPLLMGFELLLQAIVLDINQTPK